MRPFAYASHSRLSGGLALAFLCVAAALAGAPAHAAMSKPLIGQAAPTFNLPNVQTQDDISLSSLLSGKKAAVVIFVSTRCWVCKAYEERMAALAAKYGPLGIPFVGIDSNQTEPTAECASWQITSKIGFPVVKDAGNVIADAYGATHTPEVYVIDPGGKLIYHGAIDNAIDPMGAQQHYLATTLDDILAGKDIARPETKAFGCSIKRVST